MMAQEIGSLPPIWDAWTGLLATRPWLPFVQSLAFLWDWNSGFLSLFLSLHLSNITK